MTIQITKPEVEALINQRLQTGAFKDAEDVILQALRASSPWPQSDAPPGNDIEEILSPLRGLNLDLDKTGTDLVAAMQASPYKEISLEPGRTRMPVRDVVF